MMTIRVSFARLMKNCLLVKFHHKSSNFPAGQETGSTHEVGSGTQYKVDEAALEDAGEYYCIASICEGGT